MSLLIGDDVPTTVTSWDQTDIVTDSLQIAHLFLKAFAHRSDGLKISPSREWIQ